MGENNSTITDDFVAQATKVLQETEDNLRALVQAALLHSHQTETNSPLRQISRYLTRLSEQSKALRKQLQAGLDIPPIADDGLWPQIRVLQSHEEERTQLARELEDSVGQLLANAVFELASCRYLLNTDGDAVENGLSALQDELEQGLTDVRRFITDLEPATILDNFGLGAGVRRYLEQLETRTGIKTQLYIKANFGRLPRTIELAIFRVLQEALSNIQNHAKADQVEVVFEEKDASLVFRVIDNGEGILVDNISKSKKNLGLARMVDYADLLNGKLRVLSDSERGTEIILTIPYPEL